MAKPSRSHRTLLPIVVTALLLLPPHGRRAQGLTGGPTQPEFAAITPLDGSDEEFVDLFTGDFRYGVKLFDLPGAGGSYPIALAYQSGDVSMEAEATWVGLGWSLNAGAINRQVRGLPDDFRGGGEGECISAGDAITTWKDAEPQQT